LAKYENYEIELKVDTKVMDIEPHNFAFSLKDSILELYPTMDLEYNDMTGVFQEYLGFANGVPYDVTFGTNNQNLQNHYRVEESDLQSLQNPQFINGVVEANMVHDYFSYQEVRSGAYNAKISGAIKKIISVYNFSKTDIDETGNQDIWYQMLMRDDIFMQTKLLPNAFAQTSKQAPYFMWIDSNNNFNFKNYFNMVNEVPIVKLKFNQESVNKLEQNTVIQFDTYRKSDIEIDTLKNRYIFSDNVEDGTVTQEQDTITDYPEMSGRVLPSLSDDKIKSFVILGDESSIKGKQDNANGRKINSTRESLFIDNMIITTYLDCRLLAGKMVEIEIPNSTNSSQPSRYFSDKYLIATSEHKWDGQKGYSTLHLIRKSVILTSQYLIKPKLFVG